MLSKKLWEARRAIERSSASEQVKKRLLGLWQLEAKQCRLLPTVSMLYSVLPWEDYGHLGAGVMLLYIEHLFKSEEERDKCRALVGLSEEELDRLGLLALHMLREKQMPVITAEVKGLLERIVSSPYFNAEKPGGLVLNCLEGMVSSEPVVEGMVSSEPVGDRQALEALRSDLVDIYTPTEDFTVFGYLSWEQVKPGALTSLGNRLLGRTHAKAIAKGLINVEKKVEELRGSWGAFLQELTSSFPPLLRELVTSRPPKSTVPHSHALLDCIEHTWLWMLNSNIDVYSNVPNATYTDLRSSKFDKKYELMCDRFSEEALPREMEKTLRRMVIEAYLAGAPEPKVNCCDDPQILKTLKYAMSTYIERGFQKSYFPSESTPWEARDPQDLDNEIKMHCWLWNSDYRGVRLHHELLQKAGVDDEDLECLVLDDIYENEDDCVPPFSTLRGLPMPENIRIDDPDNYMWASDLVIPPGPVTPNCWRVTSV